MTLKRFFRDDAGATVIETAFALPALIVLLWTIIQAGLVFRAMSGIQHALGEGARAATIWPAPDPEVDADLEAITDKMNAAVYGIGPGDFDIPDPVPGEADGSPYLDLEVTYTQPVNLLIVPGPTISVSRTKRVWLAESES
jgi:Flp pilus assembly pilin Flp